MKKILLLLVGVILISSCTAEEIPVRNRQCWEVISYRDEHYPNGFPLQISGHTVYKRRWYVLQDTKTKEMTDGYSFFEFVEVGGNICKDIK